MTKAAQFDDVITELDQDQVERAYPTAGRRSTIWFGAVFSKGAVRRSPRPIDTAAASSKSGSEPGFPLPQYSPKVFDLRDRHLGGDAARGAETRQQTAVEECGRSSP